MEVLIRELETTINKKNKEVLIREVSLYVKLE